MSNTTCTLWAGKLDRHGYGIKNGKLAHRTAYEQAGGVLVIGLELDHLCRNRACVNPKHLEQVTHQVNILRGDTIIARNKAKTHCPIGHEYSENNTYIAKRRTGNYRMCRVCQRASVAKYKSKKKAEQL